MCGIAGIMTSGDGPCATTQAADALENSLSHRGPDGAGRYQRDNVTLVHTRLAIIDLKTGDQPLYGPESTALVANGEIYNHVELRQDLLSDASFATKSDCETILHLQAKFGADGFQHLRGMYAFALHDPIAKTLTLSRDPFGIKHLYYTETENCFAFASEPQALIATGLIAPQAERRAIGELLQLQFTTGSQTIFHGIHRLLPGETLVVKDGRITHRAVQAALPIGRPLPRDETKALRDLDLALMDSVKVHQRSDVPFGLFLSSGIDSTAILACMARLNDSPVLAYTASFPGTKVPDEFAAAHRMAAVFGASHVNVEVTSADFFRYLPEIVAAIDDPTADYAIVPTYLLARQAAKDVKVVLCGEGGDELFAGYSRYRRQILPWWLGGRRRRPSGPLSECGLLPPSLSDWRTGIATAEARLAHDDRSALQIAQAVDCVDYLPHGLLVKLDRCLMAHGLEGRTPLLDPVIANFAFRLPQRLKLRKRRGKYLLRKWLNQHAPQADAFARKKGFTVPVGEWISREADRLGPLVAADPAIAAICSPDLVKRAFCSQEKHHLDAAWRLLFYALWHRRHIRGLIPDGDLFHCLDSVAR